MTFYSFIAENDGRTTVPGPSVPRSGLVLARTPQLTDADEGARFWWHYVGGAGQADRLHLRKPAAPRRTDRQTNRSAPRRRTVKQEVNTKATEMHFNEDFFLSVQAVRGIRAGPG